MRLAALFSFMGLGLVINYVDPEKSGAVGKVLFYLTLFFFLSSFFNLFLLWIRKKVLGKEAVSLNVSLSFRQGSLLAIFVIGLAVLQSMKMLIWWDGLLLLAGIFIIELYFLSRS